MKHWEPGGDVLAQKDASSSQLKNASKIPETRPPFLTCSEAVHFTRERASQTRSTFSVSLSTEASSGSSSSHRPQRLCSKKTGHQNCCSPEPPKLHHIPAAHLDRSEPQQNPAQGRFQSNKLPSAQRFSSVVTVQSGLTSLQRKREYWKLMKRQQRARLRAKQDEPRGESSSQTLGLVGPFQGGSDSKAAVQLIPSIASVAAETNVPGAVSKTICNAEQSCDRLQVKLLTTSREENNMNSRHSQNVTNCGDASPPCCQEWTPKSSEVHSAPSLPTLKPPDNPLSSIRLQPIESPGQRPNSILSPIKNTFAPRQSPTNIVQSSKLAPINTLVPPKPIPGESEEDFLKRKREYWRIKKKEQRARKAIRDKETSPKQVCNNWKSTVPAQDPPTVTAAAQDSGQWVTSSEDSSMSMDPDPGSLAQSNYAAQLEDELVPLVADYDGYSEEEGLLSEGVWRNRYLMDHDPLNQLLVCMVCGELQYSHSLEGVRAHIEEAHPHTLTLELSERQRILEAWDEQVSQRERFFTSQLQQHSGALAETYGN